MDPALRVSRLIIPEMARSNQESHVTGRHAALAWEMVACYNVTNVTRNTSDILLLWLMTRPNNAGCS